MVATANRLTEIQIPVLLLIFLANGANSSSQASTSTHTIISCACEWFAFSLVFLHGNFCKLAVAVIHYPTDKMPFPSSSSARTPYLLYIVFITTLGPFQFGYHLVRPNSHLYDCPFSEHFSSSLGRAQRPGSRLDLHLLSIGGLGQEWPAQSTQLHSHVQTSVRPCL